MLEYYEPQLDFNREELQNTMSIVLSLKEQVNAEILQSVIERLRSRFPYFYVKTAFRGSDIVTEPNPLPMPVRNSWGSVMLNSEESNYHLASWKCDGCRLAFEICHSLTDGTGVMPYVKSSIFLYLIEVTGRCFDSTGFHLPGDVIPESETENPFNEQDIESIKAPFYEKKPVDDFFRMIDDKTQIDKHVFFLKMDESQVMRYCRGHNGTPNAFFSVMMAKAARRYDPDNDKTIVVSIAVDTKAMLGNTDNYRMFATDAKLDFPLEENLADVTEACTTARGQLMLQIQRENLLWKLKQMKMGNNSAPGNDSTSTAFVSYVDCRSFGPLEPFIKNLFIVTSLQKVSDLLCEITCINHSFFVAYMQPFSSDRYFKCFLKELEMAGIDYEIIGDEPLHVSAIKPLERSQNSI